MTEKELFFWNKLLELAKEELTQATFDYYVLDTKLIKVQDNVATKNYSGKKTCSLSSYWQDLKSIIVK